DQFTGVNELNRWPNSWMPISRPGKNPRGPHSGYALLRNGAGRIYQTPETMLFLNSRQVRAWLFVVYAATTRDFPKFPQQARALYGNPAEPIPVVPIMPTIGKFV